MKQSMKSTLKTSEVSILPQLEATILPTLSRTLRYTGSVTRMMNERILKDMEKLFTQSPEEEMALFITSPGGQTGTAMSFYDTIQHVLQPKLVTIGSGDVDSSGVIIFLAGTRRYVTNHTTVLLHPAGRVFGSQRYTTKEMEAMLAEDRLKDEQYAGLLAERSNGILTTAEVLSMMEAHTILSPEQLVEYGLAHAVLS